LGSKLLGMDAFLMDLDILEETDKLQQTFNTEEGTTLSKLYLLDEISKFPFTDRKLLEAIFAALYCSLVLRLSRKVH